MRGTSQQLVPRAPGASPRVVLVALPALAAARLHPAAGREGDPVKAGAVAPAPAPIDIAGLVADPLPILIHVHADVVAVALTVILGDGAVALILRRLQPVLIL